MIHPKTQKVRSLDRWGLSRRKLKRNPLLKFFGSRVFSRELWKFHRDSVAKGWLIGSLFATSPFLFFQIILSIPICVLFRANIPISLGLICLINPLTALPFYFSAYRLGSKILGIQTGHLSSVTEIFTKDFPPLMVGCLTIGLSVGLLGFVIIKFLKGSTTEK